MTNKQLIEKINSLEKRIEELEKKPNIINVPVPCPYPVYPQPPVYPNPYPYYPVIS